MGLGEITSRDAVLDAIDEYEDLGADAFLERYGSGLSTSMTIEYVGRRFAALPALSVAHRVMHGTLLPPSELTHEGDAQRQLETLGFRVSGASPAAGRRASSSTARKSTPRPRGGSSAVATAPAAKVRVQGLDWQLQPGDLRTRQELAQAFGCSKHTTIDTSRRVRSVLAFADPGTRPELVGWTPERDAYRIVGEGRRGDQQWSKPNQALAQHAEHGLTVRLFEECDEPWRPGGKRFAYVGAFALDPEQPWVSDTAPDAEGRDRSVFVFRLLPAPE